MPAVARIGDTVYVAGGASAHGLSRQLITVNLVSGKVTVLATLPAAVEQATLLVARSRLYLIGGSGAGGRPSTDVVEIDPRHGRAHSVGRAPVPLVGATPISVGSTSYLVDTARGLVYRIG